MIKKIKSLLWAFRIWLFTKRTESKPTYSRIVGIQTERFTDEEAIALKNFWPTFEKLLANKLMVVNATTFWSDEKGFLIAKGRVQMLEELIDIGKKIRSAEKITNEILPLVTPDNPRKKQEINGNIF